MDIKAVTCSAVCFIALAQLSVAADAGLPESCFQSQYDYTLYLKYGDSAPPDPNTVDTQQMNDRAYRQLRADFMHGPAQKAAISIDFKQTQAASGEKVLLDASSSKTPSGKATYRWADYGTGAEYSLPGGASGSYSNVVLNVTDPVCGISQSKKLTIYRD
ncbi:hypothetical protein [Pseudomonas japonica]|uniref:Uncharacterized protein n=1 Tax=Pseudomonas japonica TaxID=256466 RepID=A0A239JDC8_9PSED|nr:hypothetical protein [Pseudomonas japonica]SNT02684.1 hypothetical protein SAMN05444352_12190 [Pseudomonas japonica]